MKKRAILLPALLIVFLMLPMIPGCSTASLQRYEETRDMMDTYIRVVIYAEEEKGQDILDAAFSRMEEISSAADSWNSSGEAYELNETGILEDPSPDMLAMIELSLEYNDITDGYFDITIQPLLDLWSYNANVEKQLWDLDAAERQTRIDEVLPLVGKGRISVENGVITLKEGSSITLGGIAKGYAGDEALKVIESMGVKNALIDAGGDIKTLGGNPETGTWNIALVNPDDTTQYLGDFYVDSMAVTTSGNYERYFSPDKAVSHILNPVAGGSAGECISVTIIANTGAMADALSTGVFAMGPEKGMTLVESLDDVEVLIVDSDRNIYESSGMSKYTK